MTTTMDLPAEAARYLDEVRTALASVPEAEREELLADVETSLREDPADPELRLGPPQAFAADLRTAAGIEPMGPRVAERGPGLATRLVRRFERLEMPAWLPTLAPLWWAVRGYVVVAWVLNGGDAGLILPQAGNDLLSLVAYGLGIGGSIAFGLSGRRGRLVTVANVVLALMLLPLAAQAGDRYAWVAVPYVETAADDLGAPRPGLARDGVPVTNVYAFDREGRPLFDVQLFDQAGEPLTIGDLGESQRRYVEVERGRQLRNTFPIRYFEPGSQRVADPLAGLDTIDAPRAATPELELPKRR